MLAIQSVIGNRRRELAVAFIVQPDTHLVTRPTTFESLTENPTVHQVPQLSTIDRSDTEELSQLIRGELEHISTFKVVFFKCIHGTGKSIALKPLAYFFVGHAGRHPYRSQVQKKCEAT